MKKILGICLLIIPIMVSAQIKTTSLPPLFHDKSEGKKVLGIDLASYQDELVAVYTLWHTNGVFSKKWNGKSWETFGTFDGVTEHGSFVKVFTRGEDIYTLTSETDGFQFYRKKRGENVWKKFGELISKSKFDFSTPQITVSPVGGVILYEKHYRGKEFILAVFNMETGKTERLPLGNFNEIGIELDAFYCKVISFTALETKDGLVLGRYDGKVTTEEVFMKKSVAKKSSNVRDIFHDGSNFVMIHDVDGKIAQSKFIKSKQKWETVIEENSDVYGDHYLSDHSIVEFNVPNPTPLLHRYNGKSWDKAEKIGSKEVYGCNKYEIVKCGDTYYHAYELNTGLSIESFK